MRPTTSEALTNSFLLTMKNLKFSFPSIHQARGTLLTCAVALSCGVVSLNAQIDIPASWAYPSASQNASEPGFDVKVAQVRQNFGLFPSLPTAESLLAGNYIDPDTGLPFVNVVITTQTSGAPTFDVQPVNPDFTFVEETTVNYSAGADGYWILPDGIGDFLGSNGYVDFSIPGLPGATDDTFTTFANGVNIALELMTYVELPAGEVEIGVHNAHAIQVAMHANHIRDVFRLPVVENPTTGGLAQRSSTLNVAQAGLYPVRILMSHWNGNASLEFWTADPTDVANTRTLINAEVAGAVKAYRSLTVPTRPYVKSVSPAIAETGVDRSAPIEVVIVEPDGTDPVLLVNDTEVSYQSSTSGNELTLTYAPSSPFAAGSSVEVEVQYGGTSGTWTYVVGGTARIGVMLGAGPDPGSGEQAMILRLAQAHGITMEFIDDDDIASLGGTNVATDRILVINSSSVNSGRVAPHNFEELDIPLMNVEQANVDDLLVADSPFAARNAPTTTSIYMTNTTHELAAGFPEGELVVFTAAVQMHTGSVPFEGIPIALTTDWETQGNTAGAFYGIEAGASIDLGGGTLFTHPARRVHFGFMGDQGAGSFTDDGWKLFDAAIAWLVPAPPAQPVLTIAPAAGGNVTVSWTQSGTLYEAPQADGTWTASSVTNGQTIPATETARFYQVR